MKEKIIVSLTSYGQRLNNLPTVLDTIYGQSLPPDLVVLNLAFDEELPGKVKEYLVSHAVKVNRVRDTKVYKKFIPTMEEYPDDCIICIDDDCLYPSDMIAGFMQVHRAHPDHPVSGNHLTYKGLFLPHSGPASLVKKCYYGNFLSMVDDDLMKNCSSSDIVFSYFAFCSGHPYLCTQEEYFVNLPRFNEINGYSKNTIGPDGQDKTFDYLVNRFGPIPEFVPTYIKDTHLSHAIGLIHEQSVFSNVQQVRDTHAFRVGKFLMKPLSVFRFCSRKKNEI